jgi:hypothetical protein
VSRRSSRRIATPVPEPPTDGKARIAEAIDSARAQAVQPVTVPIYRKTLDLAADGHVDFHSGEEPTAKVLLLDMNRGAWIPVLLAPGDWELRQKSSSARIMGLDGKPLA